jgi:hypothetical protein
MRRTWRVIGLLLSFAGLFGLGSFIGYGVQHDWFTWPIVFIGLIVAGILASVVTYRVTRRRDNQSTLL